MAVQVRTLSHESLSGASKSALCHRRHPELIFCKPRRTAIVIVNGSGNVSEARRIETRRSDHPTLGLDQLQALLDEAHRTYSYTYHPLEVELAVVNTSNSTVVLVSIHILAPDNSYSTHRRP